MKKALYYFFFSSLLISLLIYTLQKCAIPIPRLISFYLNDLLIIPIVLTICLVVLRWSKQHTKYKIPPLIILYICVIYAVFFEYYLPKWHPRYTADFFDVCCYFSGGFIFYILQKFES